MNPDDLRTPPTHEVKLQDGIRVMITITLPNMFQYIPDHKMGERKRELSYKQGFIKRLQKVSNIRDTVLVPLMKESLREWICNLEISEALASNGKHFPRLHYHIIGKIKNTFLLLHSLGAISYQNIIGYHIARIDRDFKEKVEYVYKQTHILEDNLRSLGLSSHNFIQLKCEELENNNIMCQLI